MPVQSEERIKEAKERVKVDAAWVKLTGAEGVERGKFTRCPFHEEKRGSFKIDRSGDFFVCFGCGAKGDVLNFIKAFSGVSMGEAIRSLLAMAGMGDEYQPGPVKKRELELPEPSRRGKPVFPEMTSGVSRQREALAELRGLSVEAVNAACDAEMLFFAKVDGVENWIVTDETRVNGQRRRLDGIPLGERKALTIQGSQAKWPVGIGRAGDEIMLVEGGPDLLAAFQLAIASPVAMFGASMPIHSGALAMFSGKMTWIIPHADEAGQRAAERWRDQIAAAGGSVGIRDLKGFKDLNEWVCGREMSGVLKERHAED